MTRRSTHRPSVLSWFVFIAGLVGAYAAGVKTYREKRRMAILVNAIISMLLMPGDPVSMLAMMVPLMILYELGIWMCSIRPANASPFGEPA